MTVVVDSTDTQESPAVQLFFSSREESTEETAGEKKIIWKDVLREGEFAMTPAGGVAQRKPFKVVATGPSSRKDRVISMSDLISSYKDQAFEHVTIPTSHADGVLDNTGYVEGLRVIKKKIGEKDAHVLQAGLGFTEPDIAGKVRRGTIPNVSCGIFFDFTRKTDARTFPVALKHVALTHNPFMNKLEPFDKVLASDDEISEEVKTEGYMFAEEPGDNDGDALQVVWNEKDSLDWMREELDAALNPRERSDSDEATPSVPRPWYWVRSVSTGNTALVEETYKGNRTKYVIPFTVEEDHVMPAPSLRWVEVKEAMIAASDDNIIDNFEGMTPASLREKLGVALSDEFGARSQEWEVEELTFDNRVRLKDKKNNAIFIAEFGIRPHGKVVLSDPSSWAATEALIPATEGAQQPASSSDSGVNTLDMSDDPMIGRVQAARQKRRALVSAA